MGLGLCLVLLATPAVWIGGAAKAAAAHVGVGTIPRSGSPVGNWTTFHGSENRSGESSGVGPINAHTQWFRMLSNGQIRVGPVENGTQIYVADTFGTVFDLNRSDGSVLWRHAVGLNPTTPDLSGGQLVIASSSGLTDLNATSGAQNWSIGLGSRVTGPVSVVGGTVVVGTADGRIIAVSLSDGRFLWSATLGAGIAGAPAYESGVWYAATDVGGLVALTSVGKTIWGANVSAPVDSGPAVSFGRVVLGDLRAKVTEFNATRGDLLWQYLGNVSHPGDGIEATPAIGATGVYVSTDLGAVDALDLTTGVLRWTRNVSFTGYAVSAAPVLTVNAVYVWDASESIDDFSLASGRLEWSAALSAEPSYSSPAVENGDLTIGNEKGYLWEFGGGTGGTAWNVSGTVTDRAGRPIAGSTIAYSDSPVAVRPDGSFLFQLTNGSYTLTASAPGFASVSLGVAVTGPVVGLRFVLPILTLYRLSGSVTDGLSGHGLSGVLVQVEVGTWVNRSFSSAGGGFVLWTPNGTAYVTAQPPSGYDPVAIHVVVNGAPVAGVELPLPPTGLSLSAAGWERLDVLAPLAAATSALLAAAFIAESRRRTAMGLSSTVLSPFARFVAMRLILIPVQAFVVLTVLYIFGTYLPLLAHPGSNPCQLAVGACSNCDWSNLACSANAFVSGLAALVVNLFTGQWGLTSFGNLQEPAVLFLQWWGPYSLELAGIALLLSAAIAYPLGLLSGWRRDTSVDVGARGLTTVGLLVPTFLVLLFYLGSAYIPFSNTFGDWPYDVIPSPEWLNVHGQPSWIGIGFNTSPTGFPLVDAAIHGYWPFELIVLVKTLLQALIIAVIYVGIFLRYARNAVVEAVQEPYVVAARARGVPEGALLWRHTARRVWPIYLLVFGLTLPAYIGTQAVVEALANDHGLGTLLIAQMTHVQSTAFGFSSVAAGPHVGNLYQVLVFLLVLLVLLGNLAVDIAARYLDPRIVRRGGT
ncbi:MAG: PQQ-binding-like beta-propeller repeat protein [Thermoplasmata archaeon]|nr:PQQ-binding-like beta-propeller repeat protein [Thermoplasmata archaeon]